MLSTLRGCCDLHVASIRSTSRHHEIMKIYMKKAVDGAKWAWDLHTESMRSTCREHEIFYEDCMRFRRYEYEISWKEFEISIKIRASALHEKSIRST